MKQPIRMCINCRERTEQSNLFRFQCSNGKLVPYQNRGRSLYICRDCSKRDTTVKKISKLCDNPRYNREVLLKTMEEMIG